MYALYVLFDKTIQAMRPALLQKQDEIYKIHLLWYVVQKQTIIGYNKSIFQSDYMRGKITLFLNQPEQNLKVQQLKELLR